MMLRRELLTRSGLALAAGAMGSSAGWLDAAAQDNPLEGADGSCPGGDSEGFGERNPQSGSECRYNRYGQPFAGRCFGPLLTAASTAKSLPAIGSNLGFRYLVARGPCHASALPWNERDQDTPESARAKTRDSYAHISVHRTIRNGRGHARQHLRQGAAG